MAKKKNETDNSVEIERGILQLESQVMGVVTDFLVKKGKEGMPEEDKVSCVLSAFAEMTVLNTKFVAEMEARHMFQTGDMKRRYEAEQALLILLAENGDKHGLDFGRFLKIEKDSDGVWRYNDNNEEQ